MRILQVSNKYPFPPKDGGAIAALNLANGLARAGHEVSLLAMRTPKHGGKSLKNDDRFSYKEVFTTYVDTTIRPLRLLKNLFFSGLPYNAERFIDRDFREKLAGILTRNNYDIVQLEGIFLMPYGETIRKYSRAKIVLRAHNIEHEVWQRLTLQTRNSLRRAYYRKLSGRMAVFEYSFINAYDMLVPISERDLRSFNSHGNTKPSRVIPLGMDVSGSPQVSYTDLNNKLSFIGSLDYIPNQEGLIWFIEKVWNKFLHPSHPYSFYVAGRNAPARLKNYLARQPLTFAGEVEDAGKFIQSGGVIVVPVLSGGGIRVRIIEAMAMGIPVVSTSIGAEGIDVTDGSDIMIADDPKIFAEAIIKLLENQAFFANIGKNARSFIAEKMDENKLSAELLTFYQDNLK
jgi:glycosyltransferase involved in cell wall biosynthesis